MTVRDPAGRGGVAGSRTAGMNDRAGSGRVAASPEVGHAGGMGIVWTIVVIVIVAAVVLFFVRRR